MLDVVACLVKKRIEFRIREIPSPMGELVKMTKIGVVSVSAFLAVRGLLQHARGLNIQTLIILQAAPNQVFDRDPLIG